MVGSRSEGGGIAKAGAKMAMAVSCAKVGSRSEAGGIAKARAKMVMAVSCAKVGSRSEAGGIAKAGAKMVMAISCAKVGSRSEAGGIAKAGAKMVMAVSCAKVPKITIMVGGSFGAGNYGMCGRAYSPNFLFLWPTAKISVMGGVQAAGVLAQIERSNKKRQRIEWSEEEEEKFKDKVVEAYEREASPYYSTARLWDDGIIDPADTRKILGLCLSASIKHAPQDTKYGVFRM